MSRTTPKKPQTDIWKRRGKQSRSIKNIQFRGWKSNFPEKEENLSDGFFSIPFLRVRHLLGSPFLLDLYSNSIFSPPFRFYFVWRKTSVVCVRDRSQRSRSRSIYAWWQERFFMLMALEREGKTWQLIRTLFPRIERKEEDAWSYLDFFSLFLCAAVKKQEDFAT